MAMMGGAEMGGTEADDTGEGAGRCTAPVAGGGAAGAVTAGLEAFTVWTAVAVVG